ncbi:MAG TPA: hypothetical protein VH134_05835 [Candidatus Dormibacteraeota bacterium]|nr:hypothetical protein [Candidatus Dormibacteraeota bacterium]
MPGDELYHGPLDDFVRGRTELARTLRRDGDREAAAVVAKLRRPVLGAWVVDQLASGDAELVRDLLAATADARDAQRAGSGEAVRAASARVRELLDEIAVRARAILERSGHAVTDATVRRAQTTAQAAALGGAAERTALLRGTLDRDLDPPGFGPTGDPEPDTEEVTAAIAGRHRERPPPRPAAAVPPPPPAPARPPRPSPAELARRRRLENDVARRERELESAREAVRRVEAALEQARAALREAADPEVSAG